MDNQNPPFPPPPPPPFDPNQGNPNQQNPNMGNQQNPNMGNQQNPNMGNQQNPYGQQQNPNMGNQQNPYGQQQNPNPYNQNPYAQNTFGTQRDVPNAVAILILGIASIVTCWCYGIIGLGCGIAALVMANKALNEYKANPGAFTQQSFKNANAGRICAIIGLILSALYLIYVIVLFAFIGTSMSGLGGLRF